MINHFFFEKYFLGTIRSAMSKLDYLAYELGINCIELMPIQTFLLGHDWGYTTRHFFAVEPSYGSSEDLNISLMNVMHAVYVL
jgi:1,4-alpha-glucan branching enzyme